MKIDDFTLSEIIELTSNREEAFPELYKRINKSSIEDLREAVPAFELFFDKWEDKIAANSERAQLCVKLAELSLLESRSFRFALKYAIKRLLPPYLVSENVVRSLGVMDSNTGVREVVQRLKKLQSLRTNSLVFFLKTKQIFRITAIDPVIGTVTLSPLDCSGNTSMAISNVVLSSVFFNYSAELLQLLRPNNGKMIKRAVDYRDALTRSALTNLSSDILEDIVRSALVSQNVFLPEKFDEWWNCDGSMKTNSPSSDKTNKRNFADARSVLELHTLLDIGSKQEKGDNKQENPLVIDMETAEKLQKLFSKIRFTTTKDSKDLEKFAESIATLATAELADGVELESIFKPLHARLPIWPDVSKETENEKAGNLDEFKMSDDGLRVWGKIGIRFLSGLKIATKSIYSSDEFVYLTMHLPVRCMNVLLDEKDKDAEDLLKCVLSYINRCKVLNSDLCLWIWKNAGRINAPMVTSRVDMETVSLALNQMNLQKEWLASQKDLLKALTDKKDFQLFILKNADGDIASIIFGLLKYRQRSDYQSISAKLAGLSKELKQYLAEGGADKLLGKRVAPSRKEPVITSSASYKRMEDELRDLIEVQIPQNADALAYARSFGDLRENAEYDAAKERRRYLNRRRLELENILSSINKTTFRNVDLADGKVVPGCHVVLTNGKSKNEDYYILGAWDGDPDRKYLSYKTELGQAFLGHVVGDDIKLPDGSTVKLKQVLPLPLNILQEMIGE